MIGVLRAWPNDIKAWSSRPTWKNCSLWLCNVHCWNSTQYYSTETVLLIFPFLQTNITVHCSDEAKWWLGATTRWELQNEWRLLRYSNFSAPVLVSKNRKGAHKAPILGLQNDFESGKPHAKWNVNPSIHLTKQLTHSWHYIVICTIQVWRVRKKYV